MSSSFFLQCQTSVDLKYSVGCQADFGMSDVYQFLAPVSDVGLEKQAMSDVEKYPFMGTYRGGGKDKNGMAHFMFICWYAHFEEESIEKYIL